MTTTVQVQSEYRDLPIDWLVESTTNPRQTFSEDAMQELAESIRANGVLQPLLVRPVNERRFEIVFGARLYRGSVIAERETVPVCIREMTDVQVLEAQLVETSSVRMCIRSTRHRASPPSCALRSQSIPSNSSQRSAERVPDTWPLVSA
jgi:hypothetical protein